MEGLRSERANVLAVQPAQFINGKSSVGFVDAVHIESINQVFHQEKLALVSWIPAKQRDVIDDRSRQESHPHQVFKGGVALALAHFCAILADDMGQVDVLRVFPTEGFVKKVVFRGGGEILLPANDVRNFHQVVIDHIGEVVRGEAVRFEQYLVVELFILDRDMSIYVVIKTADTFQRDALAHHGHQALSKPGFHFLNAQIPARVAVAFHAFVTGFQGGFIFFPAEAVIGVSTRE